MQLILTQVDIEAALIDYANKLITIRDGMSITVDLKATRGDSGATAIINIVPEGTVAASAPTKAEPVKQTAPVKAAPKAVTPAKVVAPVQEVEQEQEEEEDFRTAALGNRPDEVADEANAQDQAQEVQEEEQEPEPESKPKSLFAGLRKPKND